MSEITYRHETYWQDGLCFVIWRDSLRMARCDSKETAESICECVNCHNDLVAALETAEKELEQRYGAQEGSPMDRLTLKIVKDALVKAKKG